MAVSSRQALPSPPPPTSSTQGSPCYGVLGDCLAPGALELYASPRNHCAGPLLDNCVTST